MQITIRDGMIWVDGEVDLSNAHHLRAAIEDMGDGSRTCVEMSGVTFIDSAGLHAIQLATRSLNHGGGVVLVNPPSQIVKIVALLGLDRLPNLEIESRTDG